MIFTKDDEVEIMTNKGKEKRKSKRNSVSNFLIAIFVVFIVFNLVSIAVIPAKHSEHGSHHEKNHRDPLKDLPQVELSKTYEYEINEFEISISYTIQPIYRDCRLFSRLSIKNGGIELGTQGEELPFYKHILETPGEIDKISVELLDPIEITATPTPYLVPQHLGTNNIEEVLATEWQGAIKVDITSGWTLDHLSGTNSYNSFSELYSLKIYPVEFNSDGSARIYRTVKVSYSMPQNYMWASPAISDPGHKPTGPVKYLMITHPDLEATVEPFAQWKSQKGLFTQVVTTEELDTMYTDGDLPYKMRAYVQMMEGKYDLDYLLLVGDWDKVPTRNTKNSYAQPMMGEPDSFASDLYFACVDPTTTWNKDGDAEYAEEGELDDSVPDMANGRLAINSPTTLRSVLNVLMNREKNPTWDQDVETAVYMCGDPGYLQGDPTEVMDYFWTEYGDDLFARNETIYYDDSGTLEFSTNSFKTVMDTRPQAMCYFGHGKPDGFPDLYNNNDIPRLLDNGTDGSLFAMACLTGWFDDPAPGSGMGAVDNCFAELLTETPDKGVVGYIGASRMAVGYIDTIYSDDAPGLEEDYWREIREAAKGNITPNIGTVWRRAITDFSSSFYPFAAQGFDNPGLRTFLEYNLLGEPDAPLILRKPETLQLEYNLANDKTSIDAKVTNSTDAPVPGAVVAIYRADELGQASMTNSKGEVTINIPPNNGGTIHITASRPGDAPVEDTFSLPDNLEPRPEYEITPAEPDGMNDHYVSKPKVKLFGDEPVDVEYHLDDCNLIYSESTATVQVPNGNHTINFRVRDAVEQWSAWAQIKVSVDLTPPELLVTTTPNTPDGREGWFISNPTVGLTANEPLNNTMYRVDSGTENVYDSALQVDEGEHTYTFITYDLAGNVNKTEITIKVDLSAPLTDALVSHEPDGENGYYVTPPTIELVSPNESSVTLEYRWDAGVWQSYETLLNPASGEHTLYYRGMDTAGNYESEHDIMFKVDSEEPSLDLAIDPAIPDGDNDYYVTNPLVYLSSSDGDIYYCLKDATEESSEPDQLVEEPIVIPEGDWMLYAKAVDEAGNAGYLESVTIKVDKTTPTLSWALKPTEPDSDSSWYTDNPKIELYTDSPDVRIYWTYTNNEDWDEYNNDIALNSGVHKLWFKAIDPAGNVVDLESTTIKVDLNAPEVNITQPQEDSVLGRRITVAWQGYDTDSGLLYYKIRLDGRSWLEVGSDTDFEFDNIDSGKHTVQIRAWDVAGNSKKFKRSFSVDGTEPTLISRFPKGKDIPIDSEIAIEFSKPMKKESVHIELDGVVGNITWEDNTAIFIPTQRLDYSSKYIVKVTGLDLYNNSLSSKSWSFYTEAAPETQAAVTSSMPMYLSLVSVIIITAIIVFVSCGIYRKKKGNWPWIKQ